MLFALSILTETNPNRCINISQSNTKLCVFKAITDSNKHIQMTIRIVVEINKIIMIKMNKYYNRYKLFAFQSFKFWIKKTKLLFEDM